MSKWPRSKFLINLSLVTAVALLAACGGQPAAPAKQAPAPAPAAAPAAAPAKQAAPAQPAAATPAPAPKKDPLKIKIAYPGEPETKDWPSVLAWRSLPKDKYDIEIVPASGIPASNQAVISGQAQMAAGSLNQVMNAILQNAPVKAIAEEVGVPWLVISTKDIKSFKDLDGKVFGVANPGGLIDGLLNASYVKLGQPKATIVRTGQSTDRVQALLKGQMHAIAGTIQDLVYAESQKPGAYHAMLTFSNEFPEMGGTYFFANDKFTKEQPEAATDLIEALLRMNQKVSRDKNFLLEEWKKGFKEQKEAELKTILDLSLASKLWADNARMDKATLEYTHKFYLDGKMINGALALEKWAVPQFVENALKKIKP